MGVFPALGKECELEAQYISARWIMSFAAGLMTDSDSLNDVYFDTTNVNGIVAHPMHGWALCWKFILDKGPERYAKPPLREETIRGVHYKEYVVIHRPIRAGDSVSLKCRQVQALQKSKGCTITTKYDLYSKDGELLVTHWITDYMRGVNLSTVGGSIQGLLPPSTEIPKRPKTPRFEEKLVIPANAAHVYTECARIWNPIHTNKDVALKAGLPDVILHGTAHLSKAIDRIVNRLGGADPRRVKAVSCGAFGANVLMPSTVTLRVLSFAEGMVHFDLLNQQGQQAIRDGLVIFHPPSSKV
mmetsp:Transcript_15481/g.19883  ORF Transcript_15481/g.19883 Transcript_15481/m.19883 type:complete len:300 (+) Transcript_15481:80-979(+)